MRFYLGTQHSYAEFGPSLEALFSGREMVTKWSHVLSVVSCRIVLLASNHLTDDTKQHATTGMNIRAE
jgi:hypothetical protein